MRAAATIPHPDKRRPRKSLGQHFLTDPRVANRIVAAADLATGDTVVEIGPGNGVLTRRLVERAGRVVAVELDERLASELPGRLGMPENLAVHHADARTVAIEDLVGPGKSVPGGRQPSLLRSIAYRSAVSGIGYAANADGRDGAARGRRGHDGRTRSDDVAVGGNAILRESVSSDARCRPARSVRRPR